MVCASALVTLACCSSALWTSTTTTCSTCNRNNSNVVTLYINQKFSYNTITIVVSDEHAGISISYMALAVHAGRGAAVLQLTNKHCKERVVTHLYLSLNARATAGRLAHHDTRCCK
eukprot:jgi/Chrzof1/13892/Cz08g16100.t1